MVSRKRVSAFILLVALLIPALAACGGGGGGGAAATSAPAGGGAATSAPAAAATSAPAATAMPEATAATGGGAAPTAVAEATAAPEATAGTAGGGTTTEGATAGASGDLSKIKVEDGASILFMVNGNPTEQKLYQDGVARFNKVFPNVKVDVQLNNDQYQTKMKAAMTAGTAPDVFILDGQLMGAFAPNNLLLPLDDAMSAAGVKASDYYDPLIQLYQLDGKTYGIPKDFGTLVVFVNNDMAQKAGVDPSSIKTWTDLQDAAKKMSTGEGAGKTFGMCLNPDIERYGASMFQNGNDIVKDGKAVFNDDKGVAAIDFWYSFKKDGTGELYKEMGKNWCGEAFAGKNAAMVVEGGWLIPFMADPANGATDVKYTAVPLPIPAGGQQGTWLFTNGFAVNAKTKYPNAAAALALYLTSAQNEKALIPSGLASPSLKALADDPFFQTDPVQKVLVDQGKTGRLSDVVLGGPVKKGDVLKKLNDALESIFLGQQSTKDALDAAAQEVDTVLQQK
jgi:multiple sugar transport system substrate-binding protein